MTRFMAGAFDTDDFLANFRFGLALETEAEVAQMLDALSFLQARANRALAGRAPKVAPGDWDYANLRAIVAHCESPEHIERLKHGGVWLSSPPPRTGTSAPARKGKAPMWARRLGEATPSYANAAAVKPKASSSTPPPTPPPTRDSSPSAAARWADVAAAAAEKPANATRSRADWAHAPSARSRRPSKERARAFGASARRSSRNRGLRA